MTYVNSKRQQGKIIILEEKHGQFQYHSIYCSGSCVDILKNNVDVFVDSTVDPKVREHETFHIRKNSYFGITSTKLKWNSFFTSRSDLDFHHSDPSSSLVVPFHTRFLQNLTSTHPRFEDKTKFPTLFISFESSPTP